MGYAPTHSELEFAGKRPAAGHHYSPVQIPLENLAVSTSALLNAQRRVPYRPSIFNPTGFYYYAQCSTTTNAAIEIRHAPVKLQEYDPDRFASLTHLRKFIRKPGVWSREQYVKNIDDTTKRKFYQRVSDQLGFGRSVSSVVCAFTKLEKYKTGKYKAPRLIQARDPSFNLEYGRYVKPIERALKGDIHFGKGTYDTCGGKIEKLRAKWRWYTECDHSTFDAHVTVEMLKLCHRFYKKCQGDNRYMESLARRTIHNSCITRHGERYKVTGTRMSGDVDTSLGNSLINYHILMEALKSVGLRGDAIVNGDDSIIFTNHPIPTDRFVAVLRHLNMESVVLPSVNNIHKVEFCRTKLIYHPDKKPTLMFDPARLRDIYGMTWKTYPDHVYLKYLEAVSHANSCMNSNSPVGREWKALERIGKQMNLLERNIQLELLKQQNANRPYTWDYLDPSIVEAYPNYKIKQQCYLTTPRPVRPIDNLINHNTKELLTGPLGF